MYFNENRRDFDVLLIAISLYNFASKNPARPCIVPGVGMMKSTSPYRELSIGAKDEHDKYAKLRSIEIYWRNLDVQR